MQKKWRKTGVALLIAGLAVSGTGYALAESGKVTEIIDLSELNEDTVEKSPVSPVRVVPIDKTVENISAKTNNVSLVETEKVEEKLESDKDKLPEIPEGYTAGNLAALAKAYEQVQNPNAKASIKRNMERAIAKWESKQPVAETPEEERKEETPVTEEKPKVEEPVKEEAPVQEEKPAKVKAKNPQAELNAKHKEQKEELKAVQKAEREALKEERKATKEQQKNERKAVKEQQKQKQEKNKKKNGNEN